MTIQEILNGAIGAGGALNADLTSGITKAADTAGTDVLVNGGFETWPLTDWTVGQMAGTGTISESTSIKRSGVSSAHISGEIGGTNNVGYLESTVITGKTPGAIYTFLGYQRNDSGLGNGEGCAMFLNNSVASATQIFNVSTDTWVSFVDFATTVIGGNPSDFIFSGTTSATFASFTKNVTIPASTNISVLVLGSNNGGGVFSVYIDDCSFTSPVIPAASVSLYDFTSPADASLLDSGDVVGGYRTTGGTDKIFHQVLGDGSHKTDFDSFNFSQKGIQTKYSTANVTDGAPTAAQLTSAFGSPSALGPGFIGILNDAAGGISEFVVWTDGTNWFYVSGTKAS